ncbi:MAG: peptidoglycan DD-metalloendopeptidase family protein [Tolumonas sp.]|jgi:septal ring factor EnvC (AmiA/AmiB activator)|uniref:murein hydrolase activator EnvC n=1 Tax=Tolumonas auensis TaxID=43948 RepID=UPI001B5AE091|nr:murein hydrolase activator EnvC [Tolumonas auensis]MBP7980072.1 peptidoglycan DD-metalloendopeptidase family protein [Tolumonas sp.]
MKYNRVGLLVGALFFSAAIQAEKTTTENPSLSSVREQIQQKQQAIQVQKKDLASLQQQLKADEEAIAAANQKLQNSQSQLDKVRSKLQRLEAQRAKLEAQSRQQERLLAEQFDEAYRMGQHDYLKLLLNQQDPAAVDRTMAYYGYMNQARLKVLKRLDATKAELLQNKQDTSASSQELRALIDGQKQDQLTLQQTQQQREKTAQNINESLQSDQQQLTKLQLAEKAMLQKIEEQRKRLEAERARKKKEALALARAKAKKEGKSQAAAARKAAAKLAETDLKGLGKSGRMSWPVRGAVIRKFGETRTGEVAWKGILIKAAQGAPVKAAGSGDVVFADWLDGFGNVLVIDHGRGYLSLYGNNQSLSKQVGQHVNSGEVVASVGNSGNTGATGVYFEIRRAGKPVNPVSLLGR